MRHAAAVRAAARSNSGGLGVHRRPPLRRPSILVLDLGAPLPASVDFRATHPARQLNCAWSARDRQRRRRDPPTPNSRRGFQAMLFGPRPSPAAWRDRAAQGLRGNRSRNSSSDSDKAETRPRRCRRPHRLGPNRRRIFCSFGARNAIAVARYFLLPGRTALRACPPWLPRLQRPGLVHAIEPASVDIATLAGSP